MKRRDFLKLVGAASLTLGCNGYGLNKPDGGKRPNFIIIIDDQHNNKHMGWTGDGDGVKTPYLDKLASESVAFVNGYTNCPVCAPTRHCMYTGRYASRHGVLQNDRAMHKGIPTMMDLLSQAGYTTADVGKMHFAPYNFRGGFQYILNHEFYQGSAGISHFRPFLTSEIKKRGIKARRYPRWNTSKPWQAWAFNADALGFEYDLPADLTSEHWVTDESINFIKDQVKNRPDKPFFLHASYFAPHHPYGPVKEFNTYDPNDMVLPPSFSDKGAEEFRAELRNKFNLPPLSKDDFKKVKAHYFGFITQVDYEIGRLLKWLDSKPEIANNTVVIFLSDHGDRMGEHGMLFKAGVGAMFEGSVAIPFMIRFPGIDARKETAPVSTIDIMPTMLMAAGIKPDADLPGSDLKPLLESKKPDASWKNRVVISEWFGPMPFCYIMARKGRYKLIADNQAGTFPKISYQLYDLENDKWEMKNLADDPAHASAEKELKDAIWAHWEKQKQYVPDKIPPVVPRSRWDITLPYDPWKKVERKD